MYTHLQQDTDDSDSLPHSIRFATNAFGATTCKLYCADSPPRVQAFRLLLGAPITALIWMELADFISECCLQVLVATTCFLPELLEDPLQLDP
jgi:hypothetical protein